MGSMTRILRRNFAAFAPRVAVRAAIPWYWRVTAAVTLLALMAIIAWGTFDVGRKLAGVYLGDWHREQARLELSVLDLRQENDGLRRQIAAMERQAQIGLATIETLTAQLREFSVENTSLKEDLAFFLSLAATRDSSGVGIHRFIVERVAGSDQYRYRLLVVQGRHHGRDFEGALQVLADTDAEGVEQGMPVVIGGVGNDRVPLRFRFFQRLEGTFSVPRGNAVRRIHARLLEAGVTRPRASVTIEP
jgi:hypothetical protein